MRLTAPKDEIPEQQEGFKLPSPTEIKNARTKRGGWKKATLAKWGVPWPPPKGWRTALHELWDREQMLAKYKAKQ